MTIEDVVKKLILYNPNADVAFLRRAYDFAVDAHLGQFRNSGEPYIYHPLAVAFILAELEMDVETLVAALLHDVVEDTYITLKYIEEQFGAEVSLLVDGVTKLGKLEYKSKEERQAANLRKMFLAMARDIRVIIIKLADRLHNLRTLKYQQEHKQREIAKETLEIFAPLAHRLGIHHIKWEMEDISFRYKNPSEYYRMAELIATSRKKREEEIENVAGVLREKLVEVNITADIKGRPKHLYSIYDKMKKQDKEMDEIFDVMAVRVIVDTVKDCYGVLGTVHTIWKPIPGRFKDYIAMPKSNMYQSLHTTVVGPGGKPLEIQIRTRDMHKVAEYGIAAHWRYKEGVRGSEDFDQKLAWLRQLLEWQHDLRDAKEYIENLKIDLFDDAVFVFTPKGDVYELPAGAIPIDFAYRVHTQIGHGCIGAKVNGRIVPLDYKLRNGDIVEIITSKHASGPSRDWLNIVKTSQAKARIRHWFKREQRDDNIVRGREILEREARKNNIDPELLKHEKLLEFGRRFNLNTADDIHAAIGDGTITPYALINRIREEMKPDKKGLLAEEIQHLTYESRPAQSWGRPTQGIKVRGIDNLLVRLAHCCNPVPGDPIVGYITRGRGVSIHRKICSNISMFEQGESERLVEVEWDEGFQAAFQVKLEISGIDRTGLLSDVMQVLTEMKISANWVTARGRNRIATIEMILEMKSKEQLELLTGKLNKLKDVHEVRRTK